ncbi:MAG: NUDIX domain-containing protein [bacterium]
MTGTYPVFTCSSCQSVTYDSPVGVVLAVVFNGSGEIVMTRQAHWPPEFWGLVAGFVEEGETAEQAALREAKEETGLDVQVEQFLGTLVDR